MPTQHLYITPENYEKLRKLDNMSAVVNSLLDGYFKEVELKPANSLEELKTQAEKLKSALEIVQKTRKHMMSVEIEKAEKDNAIVAEYEAERAKKKALEERFKKEWGKLSEKEKKKRDIIKEWKMFREKASSKEKSL